MNSPLNCSICFNLSVQPTTCLQCGLVFCTLCLKNLFQPPQTVECISCSSKNFGPLADMAQSAHNQQRGQQIPQESPIYVPVQLNKPCTNHSTCNMQVTTDFENYSVCSSECLIFIQLVDSHSQKITKAMMKKLIDTTLSQIRNINNSTQQKGPVVVAPSSFKFTQGGKNIILSDNEVVLSEDQYVFRSVLGSVGFTQGIHYWEISPLNMTENEMKIGICKSNQVSMDQGFCDYNTGWAYYTVGQLRHGSNSQGIQYGVKIKNSGMVGILLNMTEGTLSFSCNGQFLGIAYTDKGLKEGPIYPAVAMLHKAGFSYKSNVPVPAYFQNANK